MNKNNKKFFCLINPYIQESSFNPYEETNDEHDAIQNFYNKITSLYNYTPVPSYLITIK